MGVHRQERKPLAPEFNGVRPPTMINVGQTHDEFDDYEGRSSWSQRSYQSCADMWYRMSPQRKVIIFVVSTFFVIAFVILGLSIASQPKSAQPQPSPRLAPMPTNSGPMTDPHETRESDLLAVIRGVSSQESLGDGSTPQNVAFKWIVTNDPLQYQAHNNGLAQRYVLAVLFFALNGPAWNITNPWIQVRSKNDVFPQQNSVTPGFEAECTWERVDCNEESEVISLDLSSIGLSGQLPTQELLHLRNLIQLDVSTNDVTGEIPQELSQLEHLESLRLDKTTLFGEIPQEVCERAETVTVDCTYVDCACCPDCSTRTSPNPGVNSSRSVPTDRASQITDIISQISPEAMIAGTPQKFALDWLILTDDEALDAEHEHLIQRYVLAVMYYSLGGEDWTFSSSWLKGDECDFTGITCDELGVLESISLNAAGLSGTLPKEIGLLDDLDFLDLSNNSISGVIPVQFSNMEELDSLLLQGNDLVGSVPPKICNLRNNDLVEFKADCDTDPPKLFCECCTNCELANADEGGSDTNGRSGGDSAGSGSPAQPIDYHLLYGRRGERIATALAKVSQEVYIAGSNEAAAAEWIINDDPMELESSDANLIQRWILTLVWFQLDGPSWVFQSYRDGTEECMWDQVTCDAEGQVTGLSLVSGRLAGMIPKELAALDSLTSLDLRGNDIKGSVPAEFCSEDGSSFTTLVFDCNDPPVVACSCCTPCGSSSAAQEVDYMALYGRRGKKIAEILSEISVDVYIAGSSQALATEWVIGSDELDLESSDPLLPQRWILALLWYQLDGENWTYTNFLNGNEECTWDGITCDGSDQVTAVELANGGLTGELPFELASLESLKALDLHGNALTGEVPEELCLEETGSDFLLTTFVLDCNTPPIVECDCCTPCTS